MAKTKSDENIKTESPQDQPVRKETMVLRVPKPNMQIAVLGLVAFITLFQTMQLLKINSQTGNAQIKAAPAQTTSTGNSAGTGSGADVPQSMVGGC